MLENTLDRYYQPDLLSSPDIKAALDKLRNNFVVVPIDKATGNIALICKSFYASVIANEVGLVNNNSTNIYTLIDHSSAETIISNNIKDLKIKFGIDNITTENHCLPNMFT